MKLNFWFYIFLAMFVPFSFDNWFYIIPGLIFALIFGVDWKAKKKSEQNTTPK